MDKMYHLCQMLYLALGRKLTVVITAGGTTQNIDDVRTLGNKSTGKLGIVLARLLSALGMNVLLIASKNCASQLARKEPFEVLEFVTFEDLERLLSEAIISHRPDLLFMAAAVADYTPIRVTGKIRSDADALNIPCEKLPKILPTLREQCLAQKLNTFIVGFKLLSNVTQEELVAVSQEQLRKCRTNLTVANDFSRIDPATGFHPVVLVTPEGGAIPVEGHLLTMITQVVSFILQRYNVRWFKTVMVDGPTPEHLLTQHRGEELLAIAQEAGLLNDHNGNVALRLENGGDAQDRIAFRVSPRGADKSQLTISDLATVEVDLLGRVVNCYGGRRSSIDTGMQATLLNNLPQVEALLHFHKGNAIVLPQRSTEFPYPCGCIEEAEEVLAALRGSRKDWDPFMIELVNHGYLAGMSFLHLEKMVKKWHDYCRLYREHLEEVDKRGDSAELKFFPVFHGAELVGITGCTSENFHTLWLDDNVRGNGIGDAVVREMIRRNWMVVTHNNCDVERYYVSHGFRVEERREGEIVVLLPPSLRDDLIHSASICFVHRSGQILLGERLCDPWLGFFCNPGGKVEEGESDWEAARREFKEETGHNLIGLRPIKSTTLYVGLPSGRAYRVENFLVEAPQLLQPKRTSELDCGWFQIDAKMKMAPATRASLRIARTHFGF